MCAATLQASCDLLLSILTACCLLLAAYCLLLTTVLTTYYQLPTTYYLLPTTYYLPLHRRQGRAAAEHQ